MSARVDDWGVAMIRLLADGRFHSGERLAQALGLSRTAVWKRLRRVGERYALPLQAVRGRGYRLAHPIQLLDPAAIHDQLDPAERALLARLELRDSVDSTNSWATREAVAGAPSGTVCIAEHQSAGRGRHGRRWVSPFGSNLYLSTLWHSGLAPIELGGLSLAIGVAVVRALRAVGVAEAGLKWPNDVLLNDRKLAGILLELVGEGQGPSRVVVGVGLNTRLSVAQARAIDQPWIDLAAVAPAPPSRSRLAGRVIGELLGAIAAFERDGLAPFADDWNRFDPFRGRQIVLKSGARRIEGCYRGIDHNGALLLATADGLRRFVAGEMSLRLRDGS